MPKPIVEPANLRLKTEPGVSCGGHVTISRAPTAANATAFIADGNPLLTLELIAFRPFSRPLTAEEIEELPPFPPSIRAKARTSGTVVEYEETGRSDGNTPLIVAAGNMLQVRVAFSASTQSVPDTTAATLILEGTSWERVEIPVFLLIGQLTSLAAVEPASIHRAAEPGEILTQDVVIAHVPAPAKMVAFVSNGGSIIRLTRMVAFRSVKKAFTNEEIAELPPYPPSLRTEARRDGYIEYQEVARSDDRTPIAVSAGHMVRMYLEFAAPLQDFPDVTVATLTIDAANWQQVQVPLSLIIGKITVQLSADSLTLHQGESAELNVSVTSVAGPATTVDFELGENANKGWVVEPPTISLPKGGVVHRALKIHANFHAMLGTFAVGFEVRCFDRLQLHRLPFDLTVKPARITARLLQTSVVATQGDKVTCQVEFTSQGGDKYIDFTLSTPSLGVHLTPAWNHIGPAPATSVIPIQLVIDTEAPAVTNTTMGIIWSAGDGEHAGALFLNFTVNLKPDSRTFHQVITTPPGTALGGWAEITIRTDGSYTFRGHMHGSGFDPYALRVSVVVRSAAGRITVAALKSGRVGGTLSGGSRDYDWEESGTNPLITRNWAELRTGKAEFSKWYENTGVLGTLEDIAVAVAEFLSVSAVAGPLVAAAIVVGSELGALTGVPFAHPSLLAGAAVAGGVILLFGPGLVFPALVAGGVVGAQLHSRPLRQPEKQFAAQVFGDTLPTDQIRVTNLSRGDRRFCVPHVDDTILLGMGEMEEDPLQANRRAVFVHELTHAWQIAHTAFIADVIWEAAVNEVKGQTAAYTYTLDGRAWSGYGAEQQAKIVEDWYSIYANNLDGEQALQDLRFPYIQNNIRLGQP